MTPTNIVAGALVSQVSVVVIMFVGAAIIRRDPSLVRWSKDEPTYGGFAWLLLVLLLFSVGALTLSDGFSESWRPLFGDLKFVGFSWSSTLLLVFLADIVVLGRLVASSGGSIESPFQPLFFLLPTLAIFLREPTPRVVLYVVCVAVSFLYFLFRYRSTPDADRARSRLAYGVVSLLCLGLACFVGLFTRIAP